MYIIDIQLRMLCISNVYFVHGAPPILKIRNQSQLTSFSAKLALW